MEDNFITKVITVLIIAGLFLLGVLMLKEIMIPIIFGLLLAYIFFPVFLWINKYIKNKTLATFILLLIVFIVIAIPLWLVFPLLIKQIFEVYVFIQKVNFFDTLKSILPSSFSDQLIKEFAVQVSNLLSKTFTSVLNQLSNTIGNLPSLLFSLAILLFTFYFSTKDAEKLKDYVLKLSPFSESTEKKFLEEFRNITDSIVYGQFLIGLVQGIGVGLGLWVLGVHNVLLLTFLTFMVSIIPFTGAFLVWVPTSIYLLVTGSVFKGILLFIYGLFFISLIDNVLRIYLLSRKSSLPLSIAMIGIVGGIFTFGIPGLILGPLILAYILIIIDFYRQGKLNELFKK
jgi:predicted PurR-regulated permease PerM